jgi:hypothetical protein
MKREIKPVRAKGVKLHEDYAWLKSMTIRKHGLNAKQLVRIDREARG